MNEPPIVNPAIDDQLKNPPKILAVDDDEMVLTLYETMLKTWECKVYTANNIPVALDLCRKVPFTITLLDLRFVGQPLSGVDFLKEAVKMPRRPKVAILTSYPGGEEYVQALEIGHYYVAPKPYTRDALAEILRRNGIILRPAHGT